MLSGLWRRPGRGPRWIMLVACVLVAGMYWCNEDNDGKPDEPRGQGHYLPVLARGDGHMMYLMARSSALDWDWDFSNDLALFGDPWVQATTATGRKDIAHPVGPTLVWVPLIWIAQIGAHVANAFGADIPTHGYTEWHQRFVFLSSVLAAIGAVLLGRKLASRLIGGAWSPTYAAVCVLLGTSLTYYATYMPSYGHALDAAACAAFVTTWALTFGNWEWRRWALLGLLLGVAMLIRVQEIAFGVVIVVEVASVIINDLRRRAIDWRMRALVLIGGGALALLVALVVFLPQLYYWHVVYGDAFAIPQGARYTRLGSPMVLELLYSARNGWFSTHPIAYLAVIGLVCLPRRVRTIGIALAIALALQVYLNSTIMDWWGQAAWGQRRLCSVTAILIVGLAALLWRCGRLVARIPRVPRITWHLVAIVVLGSMVTWNVWRVRSFRSGRSAPASLDPTCCDKTPSWARDYFNWIYKRVGNPLQFPANAWFAWKHGVEIQRWDHAVGNYPIVPGMSALHGDRIYDERGAWRIGYPLTEPYLLDMWSGVGRGDGKSFRWTMRPSTRVIVPILMPYPSHFELWLAPAGGRDVTLRWDGEVVARAHLQAGWQPIEWNLYDVSAGEHELAIEAPLAIFDGGDAWPRARRPVGVAVSFVVVTFIRP